MKILNIKLSSCQQCYYLSKRIHKLHTECFCCFHGEEKMIYSGYHWKREHTIPEWCPLPEYDPFIEEKK